ncbi:MAG TPA: hypothetical protein VJZ94_00910 [Candidatus Paceibacterota bacterium]|nr:hypothetical protein [Candidatus Paceibacterota bacterium]
MEIARQEKVKEVKAMLKELRLVPDSVVWLGILIALAIIADRVSVSVPRSLSQSGFIAATVCAFASLACALIIVSNRPKLSTRYRARRLLREVNNGSGLKILDLAKALRISYEQGFGAHTSSRNEIIGHLVEPCPAKEFATFLCSVVYLGCKAHVPDKSLESEVMIEAEKFLLPPKDGAARGLIELIINQCRESSCISPRLYMSRFIDGLAVSRHEGITMMMLNAIDLALSKSAATRAHEYTEKLAKKYSIQQEQWQKRQEKCFVKTVRLITKS